MVITCVSSDRIQTSIGAEIIKETNPPATPAAQTFHRFEGPIGESPRSSRERL